jgi:hypothetical protein
MSLGRLIKEMEEQEQLERLLTKLGFDSTENIERIIKKTGEAILLYNDKKPDNKKKLLELVAEHNGVSKEIILGSANYDTLMKEYEEHVLDKYLIGNLSSEFSVSKEEVRLLLNFVKKSINAIQK